MTLFQLKIKSTETKRRKGTKSSVRYVQLHCVKAMFVLANSATICLKKYQSINFIDAHGLVCKFSYCL
jgi:hypothetical protein